MCQISSQHFKILVFFIKIFFFGMNYLHLDHFFHTFWEFNYEDFYGMTVVYVYLGGCVWVYTQCEVCCFTFTHSVEHEQDRFIKQESCTFGIFSFLNGAIKMKLIFFNIFVSQIFF